eukprot:TRINITY_DN186_c0_g1_i1.p1 TRINITY_DN186_c0_g1~~TRINITY_DN186_c0_g1_i1.p1  ORF type:complete len:263 (-),score=85.38 TRINITY_DN186_c0_g1_i1:50-781(-)
MSWDDDDLGAFTTAESAAPAALVGAWDDEDKDTGGGLKDNWDDEDPVPKAAPAPTQTHFSQTSSKKSAGRQKLRKEEAARRLQEAEEEAERLGKPLSYEEKRALQEKVEQSDLENAKDMFGELDADNEDMFGGATSSKSVAVDTEPKTAEEFKKRATTVAAQCTKYQESYHYLEFLKQLAKDITTACSPEDVKELVAVLNVVANDKIKAQTTKKKRGPAKKVAVKKEAVYEDFVDDDEFSAFA